MFVDSSAKVGRAASNGPSERRLTARTDLGFVRGTPGKCAVSAQDPRSTTECVSTPSEGQFDTPRHSHCSGFSSGIGKSKIRSHRTTCKALRRLASPPAPPRWLGAGDPRHRPCSTSVGLDAGARGCSAGTTDCIAARRSRPMPKELDAGPTCHGLDAGRGNPPAADAPLRDALAGGSSSRNGLPGRVDGWPVTRASVARRKANGPGSESSRECRVVRHPAEGFGWARRNAEPTANGTALFTQRRAGEQMATEAWVQDSGGETKPMEASSVGAAATPFKRHGLVLRRNALRSSDRPGQT